LVDDALRRLGRVMLCHRGAALAGLAAIVMARGVVDEQARRLELRRHLRELELRRLEFRQRAAELPPGAAVMERLVQGSLTEADGGGADGRAERVERAKRDRHAVALAAEPVAVRHRAVFESDGADRVRRYEPQLLPNR